MSETKKIIVEEIELEDEITQNTMRTYENDILGGLLAAANFKNDEDEIVPIEIIRNGALLIKFRIRPLSEDEYVRCREKHTKYVRNKQIGIKVPEDTNTAAYRSDLIYQATIEEDREKIWNNKEAWKKLDVVTGHELIGKVLKPGEKDMILNKSNKENTTFGKKAAIFKQGIKVKIHSV